MSSTATATTPAPAVKAKKATSPVITTYLLAYNLLAAASWAYVLFLIIRHFATGGKSEQLYNAIEAPLYFAQTLAVCEIFHSLFGFVSSPVFTTLMQVWSRLQLVYAFFYIVPDTRTQIGFVLAATSWSLVEVPRYLFYAVSLVSTPTYWQKFIRYSLFLILYPTGITGEVLSIIASIGYFAKTGAYRYSMPNSLNFAFDPVSFIYFLLIAYVPSSYIMYTYMLAQRKKQLKPAEKTEKKAQ